MISTLIISVATCSLLILIILLKPSVRVKDKEVDIYWIIPLIGALLLLIFKKVSINDLLQSFLSNTATNPVKVLLLFFAMSLISVYLDETGFFEYLASVTVRKANSSQKKLFVIFYIMVSLLTVFTSNDIVILTFTPFICKFSKHAKIDATPYIVSEFVAANSWSMLFVIGNPTNIYLAQAQQIGFLQYFCVMAIPTIFAGISSFLLLFFIFRNKLKKPLESDCQKLTLQNKLLAIIGLVHLAICTVSLAICSYVNLEMWLISLIFASSLFICVLVVRLCNKQKPIILVKTLKRLPYNLIPTVIGMFVVVLALQNCGFTKTFAEFLNGGSPTLNYGVLTTVFANVLNNIPMSVFFSFVIGSLNGITLQKALYSAVIGSNLGALLTPVGALAGIMFTSILKRHDQKFGFFEFVKYGFLITAVSLTFALIGLELSFLFLK